MLLVIEYSPVNSFLLIFLFFQMYIDLIWFAMDNICYNIISQLDGKLSQFLTGLKPLPYKPLSDNEVWEIIAYFSS